MLRSFEFGLLYWLDNKIKFSSYGTFLKYYVMWNNTLERVDNTHVTEKSGQDRAGLCVKNSPPLVSSMGRDQG